MIEVRCRTVITEAEMEQKVGKLLTDGDYNLLVTGACRVLKPDGSPLLVYLPGAIPKSLAEEAYAPLHAMRTVKTDQRFNASGSRIRVRNSRTGQRERTDRVVASAIVGSFDPSGQRLYCRLTATTGKFMDGYKNLFPLFQHVSGIFQTTVPDRWRAQAAYVDRTKPDWVIPGTVFTTITVNNTYATGVHVDKGDLHEGFSCLAVLRRGSYEGGRLCFPLYRVGVDMQDGDVILMDAHEWHGNTELVKHSPDAERISVVCYYRTNMQDCGSQDEELVKARDRLEGRLEAGVNG